MIGAVIVTILAGITWTGFGYLNDWRKNHQDPEWKGFDKKKLRADAILGLILGVATVMAQPIAAGIPGISYELPNVVDFTSFVLGGKSVV